MDEKGIKINEIFDWEKVKDALYFSIVPASIEEIYNIDNARDLALADEPCRFQDGMKINYRVLINSDNGKISSGKVSNQMIKLFKINESDLFDISKKNTSKLFSPREVDMYGRVAIIEGAEYTLCPTVLENYANQMGGKIFACAFNTKQVVILGENFFNGNTIEEKEKFLMESFEFWHGTVDFIGQKKLIDMSPIHYDAATGQIVSLSEYIKTQEKEKISTISMEDDFEEREI